jgi:beta-ribofuranosylaminobenzene 5'-phosphate synthase
VAGAQGSGGRVTVSAPARLHMGFLDLSGNLGRRFGSLGACLDGIATRVTARPAGRDELAGPEAARAARMLAALRRHMAIPPVQLTIDEVIPPHVGLGSGTQLGLAVGTAVTRLLGAGQEPATLAAILDRGARSGIGLGAFAAGGVLLDGGKGDDGRPPPIIGRVPFPPAWRFLLLFDGERQGLSGDAERQAFGALPPFADSDAGQLCRLAVMGFLPAVAVGDLATASAAIREIQAVVGDYFAPAQGGRFTSGRVGAALARLEGLGVTGVGQSSWGPTGFALVSDEGSGATLQALLAREFPALGLRLVAGRNEGAAIAEGR